MVGLSEQIAIEKCGNNAHKDHIHGKGQIGVNGQGAAGADEEHHRRMNQRIKGVHAQQTRGDNGVVDDGLEHQGRAADGKGRNQHGQQLWGPQLHGVAHQIGIGEVDLHHQIAHGAEDHENRHKNQLAAVGADSNAIQEQQPPFCTARRTGLLPRSR